MRLVHLAFLLAIVGVALVLMGVGVGLPTMPDHIEGAYFTRASGTPAYSGVFSGELSVALFDVDDGNLWIGAGLVCCVQALAAFTLLAVRARRTEAA